MSRWNARCLYFVGVPCVGKSTIGRLIADRLSYPFVDFDLDVEKRMGQHIEALKAGCMGYHPEYEYREKVKHILAEVLDESPPTWSLPCHREECSGKTPVFYKSIPMS